METKLEKGNNPLSPKTTLRILLLGSVLGFLADQLIGTVGLVGLGFLTWTTLFALSLNWLTIVSRNAVSIPIVVWSIVAVIAATMMLYRNIPIVLLALLLVMAVCMALILLHLGGRSLMESELAEHLRAIFMVPFQGWLGAWPILGNIDVGAGLKHPGVWSGLRGALLALPLLLIFISLFSSADVIFGRLVDRFLNLFSADAIRHLSLSLLFAWLSIGLLACVRGNRYFSDRKPFAPLKLATTDTAVLMGSLVTLFLIFVFVQLGYLFGGRETIEATSGLTLAQYARRGFFELLAVAGLTLIVLIAVAGSGGNKRIFRPLAVVLIGCVFIIQLSALQRLLLYIEEYGLTVDRVTALAVLAWIAGGLLLFAGTLLRGRVRAFAAGMTISGVAVVFLLAFTNPGALVARVNIERVVENQRALDIQHLHALGSDAVPALIENLDKLPVPQRCHPVVFLYSNWYDITAAADWKRKDWRSWTYSRSRAESMKEDYEEDLKALAGTCLVGGRFIDSFGRPQFELLVNGRPISATILFSWINDA